MKALSVALTQSFSLDAGVSGEEGDRIVIQPPLVAMFDQLLVGYTGKYRFTGQPYFSFDEHFLQEAIGPRAMPEKSNCSREWQKSRSKES
ncbi:MAG: hypothetical protein ABSH28_01650 [Acidobacteriota bacterium]|jgi:hypothetical protein